MSYRLKVGVQIPDVDDWVDAPKPEDPEIGTVAMDIETVLSHAAEYATDDDEEIWLEFIK